jgi:hypothetical protein
MQICSLIGRSKQIWQWFKYQKIVKKFSSLCIDNSEITFGNLPCFFWAFKASEILPFLRTMIKATSLVRSELNFPAPEEMKLQLSVNLTLKKLTYLKKIWHCSFLLNGCTFDKLIFIRPFAIQIGFDNHNHSKLELLLQTIFFRAIHPLRPIQLTPLRLINIRKK